MLFNEFINLALKEAQKSGQDVPVGALLVDKNNEIIARAHNRKEIDNDSSAHAEILALRQAAKKYDNWRLEGCTLYVTLEPCPMCAAAILYSRVAHVVFGAYDPLYGAFGSVMNMGDYIKFKPKITGGVMEAECSGLIKSFFEGRR